MYSCKWTAFIKCFSSQQCMSGKSMWVKCCRMQQHKTKGEAFGGAVVHRAPEDHHSEYKIQYSLNNNYV